MKQLLFTIALGLALSACGGNGTAKKTTAPADTTAQQEEASAAAGEASDLYQGEVSNEETMAGDPSLLIKKFAKAYCNFNDNEQQLYALLTPSLAKTLKQLLRDTDGDPMAGGSTVMAVNIVSDVISYQDDKAEAVVTVETEDIDDGTKGKLKRMLKLVKSGGDWLVDDMCEENGTSLVR